MIEEAIKRLVSEVENHSALDNTSVEIIPAKEGENPYPLKVVKSLGDDGSTNIFVESMREWSKNAFQKEAFLQVAEPGSFIDYVNRHKTDQTEIIMQDMNIFGHIDRFEEGAEGSAGKSQHTVQLALRLSKDAVAWQVASGTTFTQTQLAEFLEDLDHTIIKPDASAITDIIMNLKGKTHVVWKSQKSLDTGFVQLQYEENGTIGDVVFPHEVKASIQVFPGTVPADFRVALRFRVQPGGAVNFTLKVLGFDQAVENGLVKVRELIEEKTDITVFR